METKDVYLVAAHWYRLHIYFYTALAGIQRAGEVQEISIKLPLKN